MASEFINEGGCGFGSHVHVANIIDKNARGTLAGTKALSKFDGEFAILRGVSWVDTVAMTNGFKEFFAAAECT
jgi:hypothetical protein